MADFTEIATIEGNGQDFTDFKTKVIGACIVKAVSIINDNTATAVALAWAQGTLADPATATENIINYVVGDNRQFTVAQILAAPDEGANSIYNAVDIAVDALYP